MVNKRKNEIKKPIAKNTYLLVHMHFSIRVQQLSAIHCSPENLYSSVSYAGINIGFMLFIPNLTIDFCKICLMFKQMVVFKSNTVSYSFLCIIIFNSSYIG